MDDIPDCPTCGEHFDNMFEATDHLIESEDERFEPKLKLPKGYSLLIGSLLRELYEEADKPDVIRRITELTYATLWAADHDIDDMSSLIEEAIVRQHMSSFDSQLEHLLDGEEE